MNLSEAIRFTSMIRANQYKTGKVGALDFKYLPRERQLYIHAQARSSSGHRLYKASIVFDQLPSSDLRAPGFTLPYSSHGSGAELFLQTPTSKTKCRLRCQCADYYFMWEYWNKQNKALLGPHKTYVRVSPPSGRPPVNPDEAPGLCKHLLAMVKFLVDNRILERDSFVSEYLSRPLRR